MKKFTKLLSLLLAVVMMLGLAACGSNGTTETAAPTAADVSAETKADTAAAPTAPNRAILGSTTELSGDFRYPGWGGSSAGASDQDIQKLTIGYGTMETNQGGAYVWNETAVKDHTETDNDDGTATYTVTINEGPDLLRWHPHHRCQLSGAGHGVLHPRCCCCRYARHHGPVLRGLQGVQRLHRRRG